MINDADLMVINDYQWWLLNNQSVIEWGSYASIIGICHYVTISIWFWDMWGMSENGAYPNLWNVHQNMMSFPTECWTVKWLQTDQFPHFTIQLAGAKIPKSKRAPNSELWSPCKFSAEKMDKEWSNAANNQPLD